MESAARSTRASRLVRALLAAIAVCGTSAAGAKNIQPGDLRVCNHGRCAAIEHRQALGAFSSFYYGSGRVAVAPAPRIGAPSFELRLNGSVVGIAASRRLDRALVYGLNCGRFRRGIWYRLPPRAALELRRLTAKLKPLRVTRVVPRSC